MHDRRYYERRTAEGGQVYEPDTIDEFVNDDLGHGECKSRLTCPAGPGER